MLFMARVTTMVVISSLSAAGSRMLPSTEPMLYLRASQPSTYAAVKEGSARRRPLRRLRSQHRTHQIRHSRNKEQCCSFPQFALQDVIANDGTGADASEGDGVRDGVGVFVLVCEFSG